VHRKLATEDAAEHEREGSIRCFDVRYRAVERQSRDTLSKRRQEGKQPTTLHDVDSLEAAQTYGGKRRDVHEE
jgi:hypothetical protein